MGFESRSKTQQVDLVGVDNSCTMSERVGVLGAGAPGGMLALLLADAGHEVTVPASEHTSTAINVGKRFGARQARVPTRPYLTAPMAT
jgi:2-dehydropantoate 2-reductase